MQEIVGADLDAFAGLTAAQEHGIEVPIMGPDGSPLGLTLVVAGPDSERQKAARKKQVNRRLRKRHTGPLTADEVAVSETELLSESVISWSPDPKLGGKVLDCTPANVAAVFRKLPFIQEQVNSAAGDRAGFLPS